MKNFLIACSICGVLYYFRKYLTSNADVSNNKYYAFVIENSKNTNITNNVFYVSAKTLEDAKTLYRKDDHFGNKDIIDILSAPDLKSIISKYENKYYAVVEATDPD